MLHVAALRRQLEVAECLLSLGLRPNPKSLRGWTPLDEAVCLKDRAMVAPCRGCSNGCLRVDPGACVMSVPWDAAWQEGRPPFSARKRQGCGTCKLHTKSVMRPVPGGIQCPVPTAEAALQARLLHSTELAGYKAEIKAKKGDLLQTMVLMPDYSLKVGATPATCLCVWAAAAGVRAACSAALLALASECCSRCTSAVGGAAGG